MTMALRRTASLTTTVAIISLQLLCLEPLCSVASDDVSEFSGARRTAYYEDNYCRLEAFREYVYNARAVDANGTVSRACLSTQPRLNLVRTRGGSSRSSVFRDGVHLYSQPPSGQSRFHQATQLRTDGVYHREFTGTEPAVFKVARVTGATYSVGFNECYPRGSTGAVTTCDVADGTSTVETFLDPECMFHIYSSSDSPECENLKVAGETCPLGGPASASTDCANMRPYESIDPGAFNLVGSPYEDAECSLRTGGDHIVSGAAFGVGNTVCSQSPLVRGRLYSLTECLSDGTVYAKVYGQDDTRCTEEMYLEVLMFPGVVSSGPAGGICALGKFADGRQEYYRVTSCTTDEETDKVPVGPTPSPTPLPPIAYQPVESDSAPVDYRGDGDDEDLRSFVSSDDYSFIQFEDENNLEESANADGNGDDDDHSNNDDNHDEDEDDDDHSNNDDNHDEDEDDDDHSNNDDNHDEDEDEGDDSNGNDEDDRHSSSSSRHHHDDADCGDEDDCDHDNDDCGDEDDCDHRRGDNYDCGDEDDCDHHRGDSDDCGDEDDCEKDDDLDAHVEGGKEDHDCDDQVSSLTSDEIFAIAFGCSVAVAIFVMSSLLSYGIRNGAKIGPKPV